MPDSKTSSLRNFSHKRYKNNNLALLYHHTDEIERRHEFTKKPERLVFTSSLRQRGGLVLPQHYFYARFMARFTEKTKIFILVIPKYAYLFFW